MVDEGHGEEGMAQLNKALAHMRANRSTGRSAVYTLSLLAEACGKERQTEKGLELVAEGLAVGRNIRESELLRLKGELLIQAGGQGLESRVLKEAEECFCRSTCLPKGCGQSFPVGQ